MADKTTGELEAVKIGALPVAPDIYDETLIPVEQQGTAKHITGAQWKGYAVAAVGNIVDEAKTAADAAKKSAEDAAGTVATVEAAKDAAAQSAADAESAKTASEAARDRAEAAATSVDEAKTAAEASAEAAKQSEDAAKASASEAAESAQSALDSATSAENAKDAAQTAQTGAESARDTAEGYRDAAGESATQAAQSATEAGEAMTAAGTSAREAATSEANAEASAQDAAQSATAAETSAQEAKSAADTAAKDAAQKAVTEAETLLEGYVSDAEASKTEAAASATAAGESAENASASATAAQQSASDASASASAAQTAESGAVTAQEAAETAKGEAQTASTTATEKAAEAAESAETAKQYSGKPPKPEPDTGTWWTWDAESGAYTDTGIKFIELLQHPYPSITEMEADFENRSEGELAIISSNVEEEENSRLYIRGKEDWIYLGDLSGVTGVGISTWEKTGGNGAPGTEDTYTVTWTDGRSFTYTVYNGLDGEGAGDMLASVYDPTGRRTDIYKYVDDAIANVQEELTFDDTPTEGSQNPVTSDGIYKALQNAGSGGSVILRDEAAGVNYALIVESGHLALLEISDGFTPQKAPTLVDVGDGAAYTLYVENGRLGIKEA